MNPPSDLDIFEFARTGRALEGVTPVSALPRLAESLADAQGEVRWRVQGLAEEEAGGTRSLRLLSLAADTEVHLVCQRCMEPMTAPLHVDTRLELVEDPALAENADLEDESRDVIVGSRHFDLAWQLEEELLLALPYAPRHDRCPSGPSAGALKDRAPSPFAALEALKRKR